MVLHQENHYSFHYLSLKATFLEDRVSTTPQYHYCCYICCDALEETKQLTGLLVQFSQALSEALPTSFKRIMVCFMGRKWINAAYIHSRLEGHGGRLEEKGILNPLPLTFFTICY